MGSRDVVQPSKHSGFARGGLPWLWRLGWVLAAGTAHFGIEILRVLIEEPVNSGGGYATLSRLAGVTWVCPWLAVPWLIIAALRWASERRVGRGPTGLQAVLPVLVLVALLLVVVTRATAASHHISLSY